MDLSADRTGLLYWRPVQRSNSASPSHGGIESPPIARRLLLAGDEIARQKNYYYRAQKDCQEIISQTVSQFVDCRRTFILKPIAAFTRVIFFRELLSPWINRLAHCFVPRSPYANTPLVAYVQYAMTVLFESDSLLR
jgi:hypothetical protein